MNSDGIHSSQVSLNTRCTGYNFTYPNGTTTATTTTNASGFYHLILQQVTTKKGFATPGGHLP